MVEVMAFNKKNAKQVMPHFGQEIMQQAQTKGPLSEKAYLDASERAKRLSGPEGIDAALKQAGSASEIVVYADTPHGFHADYRPSYRPVEANDGWRRLMAWFSRNGAA